MIGFIAGLLVGGAVGFITASMLSVASDEDDWMEELGCGEDEEIHYGSDS